MIVQMERLGCRDGCSEGRLLLSGIALGRWKEDMGAIETANRPTFGKVRSTEGFRGLSDRLVFATEATVGWTASTMAMDPGWNRSSRSSCQVRSGSLTME